jgi:26S proteasome regulatory subunit N8
MQDIFNLSPNLTVEELAKSFAIKTNDMMLVIYLSSLIRSVVALHSLINNKLDNRDAEKRQDQWEKKPPVKSEDKDKKTTDSKDAKIDVSQDKKDSKHEKK